MSEPSQPGAADFLAYSGPAERNGWRVAFWFGLGLALAWFGLSLIQMTIALVDKELLEAADKSAGPLRRAADLGILSLVFAEAYAAWLFAARFVFQRPAWTFVTPVRRFSLLRLGCGLGVGAVFGAGAVLIRLLRGKEVLPFIADLRIADAERFGYLGAGLVFALLLHASMEGFFRGLVPQVVGAFTRSRLVISLVSGAVAAAIIPHSGPLDAAAEFALGVGLTWAVLELAGEKPQAVKGEADEPLDEAWAEPPAFNGCSTSSRPAGFPQPVHIVRTQASTPSHPNRGGAA